VRKALAHRGLVDAERARYLLPGDALAARGGKVLERSGCRRCHVSGGTGAALAADLDRSTASRFPEELLRAVLVPAAAMPDFRFREEDASALVVALLANGAAAKGAAGAEEAPRVVHFSRPGSGERARHPFAARCGPCHRALTERFGLLGTGIAGPDLSALFTPFHPGRGKGGERWSEGAVPAWARNPRSVRPGALMPPQRLKEGEAEEAAAVLRLSPARLRLPAAAASAGAAAPEALHPPATGAPAGGGVRREGGRARADGR
jgi:cytochrome c2